MGDTYCTVDDVLALLSIDAQARLATDPQTPMPLAVKGDGVTLKFDTPFRYTTTVEVRVAGVLQTPTTDYTVSPGTGTDSVDQLVFAVAPALNALITVKADLNALNLAVVKQCIVLASNKIKGALARYGTENLPADVKAVVQPGAVFYTRWYLRCRRTMQETDPIIEEFKSTERWLLALSKGDIALPASAPIAQATPMEPAPTHEESMFDPPLSTPVVGPYGP